MIDSYSKLTLDKYLQLRNIDLTQDEIDTQVEMISILSDEDIDTILSLPLTEYQKRARATAFLLNEPKVGDRPPRTIKIGNTVYEVVKDIRSFTTGQYIDYQNYISDLSLVEDNLPRLMTVFLIPKGHKYSDGYEIFDVEKDALNIPIETVLTLSRFFFRKSQTSISNTLTCLDWMMKRMEKKEKDKEKREKIAEARKGLLTLKNSVNGGDGFPTLMQ